MPIVSGKYIPPAWENLSTPAIDADELGDLCGTVQENQERIEELEETVGKNTTDIGNNTNSISTNTSSIVQLKGATRIIRDVSVLPSAWTASSTWQAAGFLYSASFPMSGVDANFVSTVTFAPSDAMSGNFAPVSIAGLNGVTIYAKQVPVATIVIPSVTAVRHLD